MRAMMLPELEAFRAFPAKGPEGVHPADINRRAAAIECYLDLRLEGYPPAQVVWTNYKRELATYHGALEHKDAYTKAFLKQRPEALAAGRYDVSKIRAVLDAIIAECTAIAMDVARASGGRDRREERWSIRDERGDALNCPAQTRRHVLTANLWHQSAPLAPSHQSHRLTRRK